MTTPRHMHQLSRRGRIYNGHVRINGWVFVVALVIAAIWLGAMVWGAVVSERPFQWRVQDMGHP